MNISEYNTLGDINRMQKKILELEGRIKKLEERLNRSLTNINPYDTNAINKIRKKK